MAALLILINVNKRARDQNFKGSPRPEPFPWSARPDVTRWIHWDWAMAQQSERQHNDPVVAAIERVLKVERDGIKTLRESEEHARLLLADARAQAAAIAQRTDACIARLHAAYLDKVEREIAALMAAAPADAEGGNSGYDRTALVSAARRLAARLTGGS